MVQKPFRCCSEKPVLLVTYSVAGSQKQYHVCSNCIKLECFSKHIISKKILKNKIKNFQNEQFEISDKLNYEFELNDEQSEQTEQKKSGDTMRKSVSSETESQVMDMYVGGYSVRQINEKTGISIGSISNIIKKFSDKLQKYDIHAIHEFFGIIQKHNLNPKNAFDGFATFSILSKNNIDSSAEFVESVLAYAKKNNLSPEQLVNACKKISQIQNTTDVDLDNIEEYCNELVQNKNRLESDISKLNDEYGEIDLQ